MRVLIVTPEILAQIETINKTLSGKQIVPITDENGVMFLNADLLTDCMEGETWGAFQDIFSKTEINEVLPSALAEVFVKVGAKVPLKDVENLRARFSKIVLDTDIGIKSFLR